MDKLTSGDAHRIWESACAIATLREEGNLDLLCAHLSDIEKTTRGIELGGMLFPNREHLNFALRKLRYSNSNAVCLCHLSLERLMFNLAWEEETGNVRILETTGSPEYNPMYQYQCQCALCGPQFLVEEGGVSLHLVEVEPREVEQDLGLEDDLGSQGVDAHVGVVGHLLRPGGPQLQIREGVSQLIVEFSLGLRLQDRFACLDQGVGIF
ncbi:MAG: hypothetical protein EOO38_21420 [Cytophagaceae bacterium]|nr:MAG: hypothetical protein EOO38_21420 [Cytophagaceae bacterium]